MSVRPVAVLRCETRATVRVAPAPRRRGADGAKMTVFPAMSFPGSELVSDARVADISALLRLNLAIFRAKNRLKTEFTGVQV